MQFAVLAALAVIVWICPIVDIASRAPWQIGALRRAAWIVAVVTLPGVGALLWLGVGRPHGPVPLPEQRMHPSMYFALERERAAEQAVLDEETEFRRAFLERVNQQRETARRDLHQDAREA